MKGADLGRALPPDLQQIEAVAREVLAGLPEPFRAGAREVVLRVVEIADDAVLDDLDIDDPLSLSGLYDGIPLTEKSVLDQPTAPDTIWLFRRAILDEWTERATVPLAELVRHVVIHELAHHFGWSDADIARIDRWWE